MKSKIERLQDKIAKKEAELQKEKEKLQTLLTDELAVLTAETQA